MNVELAGVRMKRFGRQNSYFRAAGPPDDERDDSPDESPETPTDEPIPPRVQDPPPEPDSQAPYVVTDHEP